MTIPNSDAYNWLIGPVNRAVLFVGDEIVLSDTIRRSLTVLENHEVLLRATRDGIKLAGAIDVAEKIDKLLSEAPALSQRAEKLRKDNYEIVYSHSLIGMWGAVEVAVEDTIVLILSKEQSGLQVISNAGIKANAYEPGPVSEDGGRKLYRSLERKLREDLKLGEAYLHILGLFGLHFSCSIHVLSKLEEINAVRNCLLHRGGIIDDRAVEAAGALRPYHGKVIPITADRYLEYYNSICAFLLAMASSVDTSKYIQLIQGDGGAA